jgi:hypothetical protein
LAQPAAQPAAPIAGKKSYVPLLIILGALFVVALIVIVVFAVKK